MSGEKRKPGRPRKVTSERVKQFSIRMSDELKERTKAAAWQARRSLSEEIGFRLTASFESECEKGLEFDGSRLDKPTADRLIESLRAYTEKLP